MPYSQLLGNKPAHDRLRALVRLNRTGHAYLFAGPSGIGKRLAAIAFAKSLLCDGGGTDGCADCARVDKGSHPNLHLLRSAEDKRVISVDQMRDLLRDLSFKATSPKRRIVIVDEAERLNEEAQNAFLKTLEEPPDRCVIILVTSSASQLLPTIVSRCQVLLFTALAPSEMKGFLKRLGLPPDQEAFVDALAGGLPGRATDLAAEAKELVARSKDLLQRVAGGELNAVIEGLGKFRDTEEARDRAREELSIVAHALREAIRRRELGETPVLTPPELAAKLDRLDSEALADRIAILLDRLRMIDQNANVPLVVEDALLRV